MQDYALNNEVWLTLPSLTDPFPLMMILAPVSFSMFFKVFPLGPDTIVSISHL